MKEKIILVSVIIAIAVISFFIGWGVCLFQSTPDASDSATVEKAVADATKELKDELKEARAELKETKSELKEAKAELNSDSKSTAISNNGDSDIYKESFEAIFYDVEGDFVMKDPEFKFYSDISCLPEFLITEELMFVTSRDEEAKNASGFPVFISRSVNGPVFSVDRPVFNYK